MPLPKRIQNAPELYFGLELYYQAFWDLCSCRNSAFGIGEIPWTSIQNYGISLGFSEDQLYNLHYFIPVMDKVFIEFHSKKAKNNA